MSNGDEDDDDLDLPVSDDEYSRVMHLVADPDKGAILEALLMAARATSAEIAAAVFVRKRVELDVDEHLEELRVAGLVRVDVDDHFTLVGAEVYASMLLATHRFVADTAAASARDTRAELVSLEDRLRERGFTV